MKLLLVDDDSLALEGLTTDLRLLGHPFDAIYTANGKASAVEILKREDVDMIFCDLEMPGGNGLELLAWVREHRPDIILVILSCHDEFYYAQRAVQLSCFDYILKPATPDVIGPVVLRAEELLDGRRRDQRIRKIGEAYVDRVAGDTEKAVDAADRIREYIVEHAAEELSMEDLAKRMYLTPDYLTRCFKKKYGVTISEFLMDLRLSLAAELLERGGTPVTAVAERVGYPNYSYFTKIFKKKYGVPPVKYRSQREKER